MLSLLLQQATALAQLWRLRVHLTPLAVASVDLVVELLRNSLATLVAHLAIAMSELSKLPRNLPCQTTTPPPKTAMCDNHSQ